jgi:carboxymethylenebutenolidase
MAASDAGAFLTFLSERRDVVGTKVGSTGYCMGGGLSLTAAAHHPDRIAAAASFHGGYLASDARDSPHRVVGQIKGRV